jgi:hypothetical protein
MARKRCSLSARRGAVGGDAGGLGLLLGDVGQHAVHAMRLAGLVVLARPRTIIQRSCVVVGRVKRYSIS